MLKDKIKEYRADVHRDVTLRGAPRFFLDRRYVPKRLVDNLVALQKKNAAMLQCAPVPCSFFTVKDQRFHVLKSHHVYVTKQKSAQTIAKAWERKKHQSPGVKRRNPLVVFFIWLWCVLVVKPTNWIRRACGFSVPSYPKTRVHPVGGAVASKNWRMAKPKNAFKPSVGDVASEEKPGLAPK